LIGARWSGLTPCHAIFVFLAFFAFFAVRNPGKRCRACRSGLLGGKHPAGRFRLKHLDDSEIVRAIFG
jgi:hypothetical protein